MTGQEINELIDTYAQLYYRKFEDKGYYVDKDELRGRLGEIYTEALINFNKNKNHTAKLKTYILSSFKKRMINYEMRVLRKQSQSGFETYCYITPKMASEVNL